MKLSNLLVKQIDIPKESPNFFILRSQLVGIAIYLSYAHDMLANYDGMRSTTQNNDHF